MDILLVPRPLRILARPAGAEGGVFVNKLLENACEVIKGVDCSWWQSSRDISSKCCAVNFTKRPTLTYHMFGLKFGLKV